MSNATSHFNAPLAPAVVEPQPARGVLHLTLRRQGARTVIQDCYSRVPLQVLRPVYLDQAGTVYVYLLNPCGGVLGGDTYQITVTLEAGARAHLTTPSATRLYAAQKAAARQEFLAILQAGAVLTYLPDQMIPFAHAAFHQCLTVRLGAGAWAFLGEIVAPGRLACGERFAYRQYFADLRVENATGRVLLLERTRLQPHCQGLDALGMLEGYDYLGTFYALGGDGTALPSTLAEHLHALLAEYAQLTGGATMLETGGLAVRMLGRDYSSMSQAMAAIWDVLHRQVLGYPAVPARK